jgi:hypothetical protein
MSGSTVRPANVGLHEVSAAIELADEPRPNEDLRSFATWLGIDP